MAKTEAEYTGPNSHQGLLPAKGTDGDRAEANHRADATQTRVLTESGFDRFQAREERRLESARGHVGIVDVELEASDRDQWHACRCDRPHQWLISEHRCGTAHQQRCSRNG